MNVITGEQCGEATSVHQSISIEDVEGLQTSLDSQMTNPFSTLLEPSSDGQIDIGRPTKRIKTIHTQNVTGGDTGISVQGHFTTDQTDFPGPQNIVSKAYVDEKSNPYQSTIEASTNPNDLNFGQDTTRFDSSIQIHDQLVIKRQIFSDTRFPTQGQPYYATPTLNTNVGSNAFDDNDSTYYRPGAASANVNITVSTPDYPDISLAASAKLIVDLTNTTKINKFELVFEPNHTPTAPIWILGTNSNVFSNFDYLYTFTANHSYISGSTGVVSFNTPVTSYRYYGLFLIGTNAATYDFSLRKFNLYYDKQVLTLPESSIQSLTPLAHDEFDLGSSDSRWKNIHAKEGYFSSSSIHLGTDYKLSVDSDNRLKVSHLTGSVVDSELILSDQYGDMNPKISLVGNPNTEINEFDVYTDQGVIASDYQGNNLNAFVVSSGGVNPVVPGIYTITYNVQDVWERSKSIERRVKVSALPRILLTSASQTSILSSPILFVDSGGPGSGSTFNYGNSEIYDITFDRQVEGNIVMMVNSCDFEHSNNYLYDRLGIQISSDGINFTNADISGFRTSVTSTPPWSNSATSASSGYILPQSIGVTQTHTLSCRFIRFYFSSDSSSTRPGWNIKLSI